MLVDQRQRKAVEEDDDFVQQAAKVPVMKVQEKKSDPVEAPLFDLDSMMGSSVPAKQADTPQQTQSAPQTNDLVNDLFNVFGGNSAQP